MAGRPTDYTAELADAICFRIAEGETLTAICKSPDMPCRMTVSRWRLKNSEFSDSYARAREIQLEGWAEETIDISDDSSRDYVSVTEDGIEVRRVDHDHIQRSKLRVDTRKWIASKLLAQYSDKKTLEHTGPGGGPIRTEVNAPSLADFYKTVTRVPLQTLEEGPITESLEAGSEQPDDDD